MDGRPVRFRFSQFVLSPRQRVLTRNGVAVPLIPRYFDLLHLLVRRRRDAVSKQAIFDDVWRDVIVSDGALSQAVRTLRRTLGDDSREPKFIRTVSRHGYQFIFAEVVEEDDEAAMAVDPSAAPREGDGDRIALLVNRLLELSANADLELEDAREVAERLHTLGTEGAINELVQKPRHGRALAVMRDARWAVSGAGYVPVLGDSERLSTIAALIRLRLAAARRTVTRRWAGAAGAGALGGAFAGIVGGVALYLSPGSRALPESALALAALGAVAGGVGAAGIGAGLAAAEVLARSRRGLGLVVCGALSGAIVGAAAHLLLRATLEGFFGLSLAYLRLQAGGGLDGLVMGGAAGCGYALATRQPPGGGLAAPVGTRRVVAATIVGVCCAAAAAALALSGRLLVGGMVHEIARSSENAQLILAPLGRLIGEPDFGMATRVLLSAFEGGWFGMALALGLTRRPGPVNGPVA